MCRYMQTHKCVHACTHKYIHTQTYKITRSTHTYTCTHHPHVQNSNTQVCTRALATHMFKEHETGDAVSPTVGEGPGERWTQQRLQITREGEAIQLGGRTRMFKASPFGQTPTSTVMLTLPLTGCMNVRRTW